MILPYFGKLPNYFSLFLLSCKNNPEIDWLLYTDSQVQSPASNIKINHCSFDIFVERIRKSIPFPITLTSPYDLCDFKPTYGEVLKDDIVGYDFWGHCDCDLIFGDIRHFVTEDILEHYHKVFVLGHFVLYHNDKETNGFYRRQHFLDARIALNDAHQYYFDEWPGVGQAWQQQGLAFYNRACFDDIYIRRYEFWPTNRLPGCRNYQPRFKSMKHIIYSYHDNALYRIWEQQGQMCKEEILYIHLQKRKMEMETAPTEQFLIVPNKFIPFDDTLTVRKLKSLSPFWSLNRICINLRRDIKHILYLIKVRILPKK